MQKTTLKSQLFEFLANDTKWSNPLTSMIYDTNQQSIGFDVVFNPEYTKVHFYNDNGRSIIKFGKWVMFTFFIFLGSMLREDWVWLPGLTKENLLVIEK